MSTEKLIANPPGARTIRRRSFLASTAGIAASATIGGFGLRSRLALAAALNGGHPLAPKRSHFPARAKRLVIFFMTGGISHVDTFDHKPRLDRDHDKSYGNQKLKRSDFAFRPRGDCGHPVSELFPELGGHADRLCFIHSLYNDSAGHSKATLAMHTGSVTIPMPSLGAWVGYGLGTDNPNLPPFVVFAKLEPYTAHQCWGSDFLPVYYRGLRIAPPEPIPHIEGPIESIARRDLERAMLRDVNESHRELRPGDVNLASRLTQFDTAYGLMREAPEAFDVSREPESIRRLYGVAEGDRESLGWQCLATRRLLERGVRVIELFDVGSNSNWDSHSDMSQHRRLAERLDRPLAALITDLEQRGLLDETLIVGCSEFGRTPWQDLTPQGRGHHARAFTVFFAGGGVRAGTAYGASDELGDGIAESPVHVHDFHATILHLLGLDHTRLTYHYGGRDFRLTDVAGNVVEGVLA
jgi:hypothetical protein